MGFFVHEGHALGTWARLTAAAFLAAALALGFAGPAAAQGMVKSVHKDWQVRCDSPPGAKHQQCALMQSVVSDQRANVGLTVIVLKAADNGDTLMRVVAPLGVLLPARLGLKIDNMNIGGAPYARCLPGGCIAEVQFRKDDPKDQEIIKKLLTGKIATFFIQFDPAEAIGFPISLAGFAEGYKELP